MNAEFEEADNITDTYQVRSGAELIGQVSGTSVHEGKRRRRAAAGRRPGPAARRHRIRIRPRSPIGVRYVELHKGTEGEEIPEGAHHPGLADQGHGHDRRRARFAGQEDAATRPRTSCKRVRQRLRRPRHRRQQDRLAGAPQFLQDTAEVFSAPSPSSTARSSASSPPPRARPTPPTRFATDIAEGFEPEAEALGRSRSEESGVRSTLEEAPPTLQTADSSLPGPSAGGGDRPAWPRPRARCWPTRRAPSTRPPSSGRRAAQPAGPRPHARPGPQAAVSPTLGLLDTIEPVPAEHRRQPAGHPADPGRARAARLRLRPGCSATGESMLGLHGRQDQHDPLRGHHQRGVRSAAAVKGVTPNLLQRLPQPCQVGTERTR